MPVCQLDEATLPLFTDNFSAESTKLTCISVLVFGVKVRVIVLLGFKLKLLVTVKVI